MSESKKTSKNAVIIGAGPAGLTAAYVMLKETDIHPIIIEETADIGGISKTVNVNGNRMDMGGHRFFSKSDKVNEIWKELLPLQSRPSKDDKLTNTEKPLLGKGLDPEKNDKVMLMRNRVSRIYFLKKFFDYPISIKPSTFINMGFVNTFKAGMGFISSSIKKRPEKSLEDFYINRFGKHLYEMFFKDYTEKLWGIAPDKISADWGAQRVKELSLSKALKDVFSKIFIKDYKSSQTSLIEQFMYPKLGPGQLWETMAQKVINMGGEIRLNSKVVGINSVKDKIISADIKTSEKIQSVEADYFLSAMPVKDLVSSFNPSVPKDVFDIAYNLPYRDFITVGLLLKKLKVKNKTKIKTVGNIVPDCWIYMQEREVKTGRIQIFNNWSPYMVKDFENTVWIGLEYFCTEGDELWSKSREEFISFAIDELVKINMIDRCDILSSACIKVKKAYPAYFGTYKNFDKVRKFLDGFKNLYCIGRNGQHRYNNMDHSMMTAVEAVNLIKNKSENKSAVWNVNTEKQYHEGK